MTMTAFDDPRGVVVPRPAGNGAFSRSFGFCLSLILKPFLVASRGRMECRKGIQKYAQIVGSLVNRWWLAIKIEQ